MIVRHALAFALLLSPLGAVGSAEAADCTPKRCIGLVGYVPVLYSQSELWWDTIDWNGKTVRNRQHVFFERGVPAVNAIVTLDWEGLPLMGSAEAKANIDALGSFKPRPDGDGYSYVLEHPPVVGRLVMHRGARLRILSYQTWPQTRSGGLFDRDEVVQDLLFALVSYEGDPTPGN